MGASSQWKDPGGVVGLRPTYEVTGQFEMVLEGYDQSTLEDPLKYAPSWCMHCKHWKPPRAHHDSMTGRCVLRMDHFCPFTGNVIGFRNQGHFFLMYCFAFVGLMFSFGHCGYLIYQVFDFRAAWYKVITKEGVMAGLSGMIFQFIVLLVNAIGFVPAAQTVGSIIALLAVCIFGATAGWMVVTNQTTLECTFPYKEYVQIKQSVYCPLGPRFYDWGWKRNVLDLFGRVTQVEQEGCKQEVASVRDLGIDPGPDEEV